MAEAKFVKWEDKGGEWRWNLVSKANGQTICTSGEGFSSESSCDDNIERVRSQAGDAEVEVKES